MANARGEELFTSPEAELASSGQEPLELWQRPASRGFETAA
jgi:hypothetical protein